MVALWQGLRLSLEISYGSGPVKGLLNSAEFQPGQPLKQRPRRHFKFLEITLALFYMK